MKVYLMHRDRDFDVKAKLPANEIELIQDLELGVLFKAMGGEDKFLLDVAKRAVLSSLVDVGAIEYRQAVLQDCLKNPEAVRDIYRVGVEALSTAGADWAWYNPFKSTDQILGRSVRVLEIYLGKLRELRNVADKHANYFQSEGFKKFFAMIKSELSDDYLATLEGHLKELEFGSGILVSVKLGSGNKGSDYTFVKLTERKQPRAGGLLSRRKADQFTITLNLNDETGPQMLAEMRDRGINNLSNTLAQSTDHVTSFFESLRTEVAFYVACLNLHDALALKSEPTCFPSPEPKGKRTLDFQGLYDTCLALKQGKAVGNDASADGKDLIVVTGANRGGKSTFLRSIGIGLLLMQCGCFVSAQSFSSDTGEGLFTHFKREEDVSMKSGKLDEELKRMSDIVDHLRPNSVVLFNESFAATNEREGSEISRQIVSAILESGVKVFFVTHQYEFARSLYDRKMPNALFLRAERRETGERTFRIIPGEPLQTSYGEDLYEKIFHGIPIGAASPPRKA
jgi:DNA mismatch repair ATPase MutS